VEGSEWSATNISRYVPLTGLDFLVAADYVYIQQTIELIDSKFVYYHLININDHLKNHIAHSPFLDILINTRF
jgi:hypothetical protein